MLGSSEVGIEVLRRNEVGRDALGKNEELSFLPGTAPPASPSEGSACPGSCSGTRGRGT